MGASPKGIEPRFVDGIYKRGARSAAFSNLPPPPEPVLRPSLARFSLAAWGLSFAGQARETERPHDILQAVNERVPQALLRDLHRPVRPVPDIHLRIEHPGPPPSAQSPRTAVRAAMIARYTVRMSEQPSARCAIAEATAERRAILDAPWEHARPAEPTPQASLFAHPEDALWFGTMGGYDPDQ